MNDSHPLDYRPPASCNHDWREEFNTMALRCVKCQWRKSQLSDKYGPPLNGDEVSYILSDSSSS